MIIEISIAVATLAFVALVIYLILTLRALCKTLAEVNLSLKNAHDITSDLHQKLRLVNPVFEAISLVGDKAIDKIETFAEKKSLQEEEIEDLPRSRLGELMDWVSMGVHLWNTIKKRR